MFLQDKDLVLQTVECVIKGTLSDWRNKHICDVELAVTLIYHLAEAVPVRTMHIDSGNSDRSSEKLFGLHSPKSFPIINVDIILCLEKLIICYQNMFFFIKVLYFCYLSQCLYHFIISTIINTLILY